MIFSDVIKSRYSVRKFTDEKVSQEMIAEILEVGRIAPSAGNHQPTAVCVLDEEKIERLKTIPSTKTERIHPVVFKSKQALVVCYNKKAEMKRPHDRFTFGVTDSSIATTYMMLKITELIWL